MKRWVRPLQDHIDIANRHKADLINRIVYLHAKLSRLQSKGNDPGAVSLALRVISEVVEELWCVKDEVLKKYPHFKEYFSE